MYRKWKMTFTP
jgi:hypothetical protein